MKMPRWRLYLTAICLAILASIMAAVYAASESSDGILQHAITRHQFSSVPHLKTKPSPAPAPSKAQDNEDADAGDFLDATISLDFVNVGSADSDEAGTSTVGAWMPVTLSEDTARVALDAVRYRNNYAGSITTRLCLHRINLIRSRLVNDLTSYLFSVDGCESTKIAPSGRCDIYYCKLATYELKVTQKTATKDIYIVQSIFKTLSQKTISELMAPSNLDFNDYNDDDGGDGTGGDSKRERALAQAPKGNTPQRAAAVASIQEVKLLLRALHLPSSHVSSAVVIAVGLEPVLIGLAGLVAGVVLVALALAHRQRTRETTATQALRQWRTRGRRRRQPWLHPLRTSLTASTSALSVGEHSGLLGATASQRNNNLEAL